MSALTREVMKDYARDRDMAERLLAGRREALWKAVPRIKDIDMRLSSLGLLAAQGILYGESAVQTAEELARESAALREERRALISGGAFDEDESAFYTCPVCKDTGFNNGAQCACFKRRLTDKFYKYSNLSGVLAKENFDTFNIEMYSNEVDPNTGVSPRGVINTAWTNALKFVGGFGKDFVNLLLYGETGLGKTFLCNCIAKELLDRGFSVIYATSPQLFKMVEKARFDKKDDESDIEEYLQMLTETDLLIIDDLGTEMSTVVTVAELFNIINSRLISRRSTIISTNYDIPEINARYSDRITSRVFGNFTVLKFAGDDIRIKIRYGK
ncbi:MAG: ATP-binding protein [Clostridiales bacterium]|jgi:DNA replication protein DnaC|nr:ATP-binding protein [Clostridiales bacterium]